MTRPAAAIEPSTNHRIEHPLELVELVRREGAFSDGTHADWFREYIDNAVASLGLALLGERHLARERSSVPNVFRSPTAGGSKTPPGVFLERVAAVRGLQVHPGGKTCLGLSPLESLQYQPEFNDTVGLKFVAVEKDSSLEVSTSDGPSPSDLALRTFGGLEFAVRESLPPGSAPRDYVVLPVHPWQFNHVVPDVRRSGTAGQIIPVEGFTQPASPLSSFRTLAPRGTRSGDPSPRVKLPVAVFKQGHKRLLPISEVRDGPRLTELLEHVLSGAEFERIGVLGEFAGACYFPADSAGGGRPGPGYSDNLSALFRTEPSSHHLVEDGDVPVCAASLLAEHPAEAGTVLHRFIERYADEKSLSTTPDAVHAFLSDYVDCVVPGSLRLISKYGIGLEIHSQNTLIVFDESARPKGALVRDFSGVRIANDRLARSQYEVTLSEESRVDASIKEMYETHYALFMRQLGDLIFAITGEFHVEERDCWHIVRETCEETFEILRSDSGFPPDRVDGDADELFGENMDGWAFLSRRILGRRDPMYFSVSNPLSSNWNPSP